MFRILPQAQYCDQYFASNPIIYPYLGCLKPSIYAVLCLKPSVLPSILPETQSLNIILPETQMFLPNILHKIESFSQYFASNPVVTEVPPGVRRAFTQQVKGQQQALVWVKARVPHPLPRPGTAGGGGREEQAPAPCPSPVSPCRAGVYALKDLPGWTLQSGSYDGIARVMLCIDSCGGVLCSISFWTETQ